MVAVVWPDGLMVNVMICQHRIFNKKTKNPFLSRQNNESKKKKIDALTQTFFFMSNRRSRIFFPMSQNVITNQIDNFV